MIIKLICLSELKSELTRKSPIILTSETMRTRVSPTLFSLKNAIVRLANAATLAIFNQSQTKDFEIFIPPFEEQTAIVAHIEKESARIDAKVEKTKKLIELLKEYRTALISEAVTGKIKVTEI